MQSKKIVTQVRIEDAQRPGRPYFYWTTVANPEKAKIAAIKKHQKATGMSHEIDLTATIVPKKEKPIE